MRSRPWVGGSHRGGLQITSRHRLRVRSRTADPDVSTFVGARLRDDPVPPALGQPGVVRGRVDGAGVEVDAGADEHIGDTRAVPPALDEEHSAIAVLDAELGPSCNRAPPGSRALSLGAGSSPPWPRYRPGQRLDTSPDDPERGRWRAHGRRWRPERGLACGAAPYRWLAREKLRPSSSLSEPVTARLAS